MAKQMITFEVSGADIWAYWIAIDDKDLRGSARALAPGRHTCVWWMRGEYGAEITVRALDAQGNELNAKTSSIPKTDDAGFDGFKFMVKDGQ